MKIAKDTVATLSYTVTETTGQVVGRTEPGQPVTALIGHRFLVKGLENALLGHEKGDEFAVTLEPKDTYGENRYEREYDRLVKIRFNKAKSHNYKEIITAFVQAFKQIEIEVYTEEVGE